MARKDTWIAGLAAPVIIALLLMVSPGVTANDSPPAATAQVKIDNFSFGPQTLRILAGTTVIWTNRDAVPHTVVSTGGVFKSKVRDTNETFSYTFSKTGTYPYHCSVHPKMTGKVVVR